mmetsp:Transcript_33432/g.48403  ORF Transcript_33432/g.48403 Transcript_33432/m.48403 type:complete len:220 (-) Transcript_33432:30-689(-)
MSIPGTSSTSHNVTPTHQNDSSTAVAPPTKTPEIRSSSMSVSFSSVQIFEFDLCLGPNPPTSGSGPSISLGDSCVQTSILSVDDYENSQTYRRSVSEMRIPCYLRFNIATNLGYTTSEIHANVCKMKHLRTQREKTAMKLAPNGFMIQRKAVGGRCYSQSPREIFTRSNPLDGGKISWKRNRNYYTRRQICLTGPTDGPVTNHRGADDSYGGVLSVVQC